MDLIFLILDLYFRIFVLWIKIFEIRFLFLILNLHFWNWIIESGFFDLDFLTSLRIIFIHLLSFRSSLYSIFKKINFPRNSYLYFGLKFTFVSVKCRSWKFRITHLVFFFNIGYFGILKFRPSYIWLVKIIIFALNADSSIKVTHRTRHGRITGGGLRVLKGQDKYQLVQNFLWVHFTTPANQKPWKMSTEKQHRLIAAYSTETNATAEDEIFEKMFTEETPETRTIDVSIK